LGRNQHEFAVFVLRVFHVEHFRLSSGLTPALAPASDGFHVCIKKGDQMFHVERSGGPPTQYSRLTPATDVLHDRIKRGGWPFHVEHQEIDFNQNLGRWVP